MDETKTPPGQDIRDRTFEFACKVVELCEVLFENGGIGRVMAPQLLNAGTSASAPVRFAPGAPDPLPTDGLASLAEALRAAPGVPVAVEGYTAAIGTDGTRSQELSQQRAQGVVRSLAALGVDPARLRAVGRGDSRPLRTLDESRRVELQVG